MTLSICDCRFRLIFYGKLPGLNEPIGNRQLPIGNVGEVQEWMNWQHWKCCERGTVPWVRIPPSPPQEFRIANCELRIWNLEFEISGSSERDPNQYDQLTQKKDGLV